MSVVSRFYNSYNTRIALLLAFLVLSAVACNMQVPRKTVPTTPTTVVTTPSRTPKPLTTVTTPGAWIAEVKLPVVNIRKSANGDPTGSYLKAGDQVQIVSCTGDWCQISKPINGFIFRGCLSDNPKNLGCEAK